MASHSGSRAGGDGSEGKVVPSSLKGCTRKNPCQPRGEARVEGLLAAAVKEFVAVGYAGATMSSIAGRAGASIGSLYQFFPNKEAVARAVRTRHIEDIERVWGTGDGGVPTGSPAAFTDWFVALMIDFVDTHPAFIPLQDAPACTQPVGPRNRLRVRLAAALTELLPESWRGREESVAEVLMQVNKSLMSLYGRVPAAEKPAVAQEYRLMLRTYLEARCGLGPDETSGSGSAKNKHGRRSG